MANTSNGGGTAVLVAANENNLVASTQNKPNVVVQETPSNENKNHNLEVNSEDLEALIDMILDDPSINIDGVPDSIERSIYKTTIQLILNIVYNILSSINGMQIFGDGHEIRLNINTNTIDDDDDDDPSLMKTTKEAKQQQKEVRKQLKQERKEGKD